MSSQAPLPFSTAFINPSTSTMRGTFASMSLLPSSEFPSSTFSVGNQFPDFTAAQYVKHSHTTDMLSSTNHSQIQPSPTRKMKAPTRKMKAPTRKRKAPTRKRKAPTISAKKWKPAGNRIKELWVEEGKTLGELRDIVNSEFGFTANERQYKCQIGRMRLEKNAKEGERRPILRHLKYRERKAKKTKYIRVRGHEIAPAKVTRWKKEQMSLSPLSSPSPLPSAISFVTGSPSDSPATPLHAFSPNKETKARSTSPMDGFNVAIQRLFACVDDESATSLAARPAVDALQLILGCERQALKDQGSWDTFSQEYIKCFPIPQLNIAQELDIHREWNQAHQDILGRRNLFRTLDRHATWWTAYGMVQISYTTSSEVSHHGPSHQKNLLPMNDVLATRITFIPKQTLNFSFAAVLDFSLGHDPFARITYQEIFPNDSLIFKVVSAGDVDGLNQMLKDRSGRLTDRDEEGRSLLNYSVRRARISMTKFLLENGQDPNSFELDEVGFPSLLHYIASPLHVELPAEERNRSTECHKLMLEAGADFSLPYFFDGRSWNTGFQQAIYDCQEATFEHILNLGMPSVSPNTEFSDLAGNARSVLSCLASECGYMTSSVIQIVDKAILILKRKGDIAYRDADGDTVLHTLLSCERAHDGHHTVPPFFFVCGRAGRTSLAQSFFLSLTEPVQLLTVFLSAGADVYAVNNEGETPSSVARQYGRLDEWNEALTACGYNHEEISAYAKTGSSGHAEKRLFPRLSFEEVCRQRQEYLKFKEQFFEERCRTCREPFHPALISFAEECLQCGEKFHYRKGSLDTQYKPLRDQYLREKTVLTQYRQRLEQSVHEECQRFLTAVFGEYCQSCRFRIHPGQRCFPRRCSQCGAKIRSRSVRMDGCYFEYAEEYYRHLRDGRIWRPFMRCTRVKRHRDQSLDGDDIVDEGETNSSAYSSDLDSSSDADHSSDSEYFIASDEAGVIQTKYGDVTPSDAEMAELDLADGPRIEPDQMNMQAMDLNDTNMAANFEARESGCTESPADNRVVDAGDTVAANAAQEEPLFQGPSIEANDDPVSFQSQIPAGLNNIEDFFDFDRYFEEFSQ